MALGALANEATKQLTAQLRLKGGVDVETIAADASVDNGTSNFCRINGGTSSRNIDLPAESSSDGLMLWICNSGTTNNLVIRDDTPATIATLRPGESALVACNGSAWVVLQHVHDVPTVLTVPIVYGEGTQIDQFFWVAPVAYRVISIVNRPFVVGSDGGAVTAVVKKAASGTAIGSGTALMSDSFDLKATINTNVAATLSATASDLDIAAGTCIGVDFTGTLTAARGVITVALIPA